MSVEFSSVIPLTLPRAVRAGQASARPARIRSHAGSRTSGARGVRIHARPTRRRPGALPRVVQDREAGRGGRASADAGPGEPLGLQGRHPARRALRRRPTRSGQVRDLPAGRGASTTWWTSGSAHPPSARSTRSGWTPSTAARSTCPEGVGHAFLALEDNSTLTYLCSTGYAPGREHGINPVDPDARPGAARRRRLPAVRQGHRRAHPGAGRRVRPAADLGCLPEYIASLS